MKNRFLYIIMATLIIGSASCSKDFLIETPSDVISASDLEKAVSQDPALLNGNIAGLYTTMFETETGGTTGHDDFGQKGFDIFSDLMVSDMALLGINYGWYRDLSRYTSTVDFTQNNVYIPWRYYYRIIFAANTVIDALGGTDAEIEERESRHIMGQAKAVRAYAYFYLANLYSREGYGTGNEQIIPIYDNTQVPNQPLSSTKEVYDLIVSDLTTAIEYLDDFNRDSKSQVNKSVAQGLLAYALAARASNEDLKDVVTITNEIIGSGKYPLTQRSEVVANLGENGELLNPQSGFNDVNTPSWMWGVDLTLENGLNLVSWWGQIDMFTYSYASVGDRKGIDKALFDQIPETDIRKNQFWPSDLTPRNKFFTPARVIQGQRYIETDYIYMRSDEMVLLNAEANAKLGDEGAARTSLKKLLDLRVEDSGYIDLLTGQALLDEIYLQSRIELWGEGKTYLAMKRNKKTIVRGSNHLSHAGKEFKYNAPELTFPIPQSEVLNNPEIN